MPNTTEQIAYNLRYMEYLLQSLREFYTGPEFPMPLLRGLASTDKGMADFNNRISAVTRLLKSEGYTSRNFFKEAKAAAAQNIQAKPPAPKEGVKRLTGFDVYRLKINNTLKALNGTLSKFSNDSPEFRAYLADVKALDLLLHKDPMHMSYDDVPDFIALTQKVKQSAEKYYQVRSAKEPTESTRRSRNRLKITANLNKDLDDMLGGMFGLEKAVESHLKERSRVLNHGGHRYDESKDANLDQEKVNREFETLNQKVSASDNKLDNEGKDVTKDLDLQQMRDLGWNGKTDTRRFETKIMLRKFAEMYRNPVANDIQLESILYQIDMYSRTNVSSTTGAESYREEIEAYNKIYKDLVSYYTEKQEAVNKLDAKNGLTDSQIQAQENSLAAAASMLNYFESQSSGDLRIPEENVRHIRATHTQFKYVEREGYDNKEFDRRDDPLFPHEPSPEDISQGYIGDCFFVSTLAAIAQQNPQAIKDAMKDNGDGTVTVRLFSRRPAEGFAAGTNDIVEPLYVTVDKFVPSMNSAQNCLWIEMFERAMVASGLMSDTAMLGIPQTAKYAQPVPENVAELYEKYSKMNPSELPSHEECPWLIDKEGKLHEWKPDYDSIDHGGFTDSISLTLLGEGYESEEIRLDIKKNAEVMLTDALTLTITEQLKTGALNLSKEDKDRLLYGMKNDTLDSTELMTICFTGKMPEIDSNGKRSITGPGAASSQRAIAMVQTFFASGRNIATAGKFFESVLNSVNTPSKSQTITACTAYIPKTDGDIQKLRAVFGNIAKVGQNRIYSASFDGDYKQEQLELLDKIKSELDKNHIITASTIKSPNDTGDTEMNFGLNYSHAYTVTGLEDRIVDGNVLHFVKVRNPHGTQDVRDYGLDEYGQYGPVVKEQVEGAESVIELNDFYRDMGEITFASRSVEKTNPLKIGSSIDKQTFTAYSTMLKGFIDTLNTNPDKTTNDLNFVTQLKTAKYDLAKNYGTEVSNLKRIFSGTQACVTSYLNYAKEHPEHLTNLNNVKSLSKLAGYAMKGIKDPIGEMKNEMAAKIASGLVQKAKRGDINKVREDVLNHPVFREKMATIDPIKMAGVLNGRPDMLADTFLKLANAPQAVQSNAQKTGKELQNNGKPQMIGM